MPAKRKSASIKKSATKSTSRYTTGPAAAKIFDTYVSRKNPALSELATAVRRLIKKALPNSSETINPWGIPTFNLEGPFAYIMIGKSHVTFGFIQGASLRDPAHLLEGTGKNLRYIKLSDAAQLRDPNLLALLGEAATFSRANPLSASMRRMQRRAFSPASVEHKPNRSKKSPA